MLKKKGGGKKFMGGECVRDGFFWELSFFCGLMRDKGGRGDRRREEAGRGAVFCM